jgi:hypothetical protein
MNHACQSQSTLLAMLSEAAAFASAAGPVPSSLERELEELRGAVNAGDVSVAVEQEIVTAFEIARRRLARARKP